MRTALLFFAFIISFQSGVKAQLSASTDRLSFINKIEPEKNSDPSAVKPPVIHAPEILRSENSIVFTWESVEKPLRFKAGYEIKIFEKTREGNPGYLLYQKIAKGNQLKLDYPERFLNTGTDFLVTVNSRLTGNDESYLIKGDYKAFSYIPDCTPPANVRVEEFGKDYVVLRWDGAIAASDGIHYEIRYGTENEAIETVQTLPVMSGLSQKIEGLSPKTTYQFEVRKVCDALGAEESKWVGIQQAMKGAATLPDFNCGDPFQIAEYDDLPDLCIGHPEYGMPLDEIFYIGGFPIQLEEWTRKNCEETLTEITSTEFLPAGTEEKPVYCYEPITEEIRVDSTFMRCEYEYIYDYVEVEHCYLVNGGGDRKEYDCATDPYILADCTPVLSSHCEGNCKNCTKEKETVMEEILVDSTLINCEWVTEPVAVLDTIGWDTIVCDIIHEVVWEEQVVVIGTEILECGCSFSGEGIVPLPFLGQKVRVEFNDVLVKVELLPDGERKHHIYEGKAFGMWDETGLIDYGGTPGVFGGDICVVTPSQNGWNEDGTHITTGTNIDPNGFTQDGKYDKVPPYPGWQDGDAIDTTGTYDPWGFDANGIHKETGTATNESGCTREQLSSQPQDAPCDNPPPPYAWLNTDVITQEGLDFTAGVKDTMETMITRILNRLKTEAADSLTYYSTNCQGLRTSMEGLVTTLGYDRHFIFGPNDDYFKKGMHEKFSREPKELGVHLERVPEEKELEKKHVALYHCDKKELQFSRMDAIIDELLTKVPALKTEILEKIKRLSAEEIKKFTDDIQNFETWVTEYLQGETESIYAGTYSFSELPSGDINDYQAPFERSRNRSLSPSFVNMTGGLDNELNGVLSRAFETRGEEIDFQIKQGWQMIDGVERVYYLEQMVKNRRAAVVTGMATEANETLMPIVVANRGNDGRVYSVYLDNIVFTPQVATMDVHILLEIPNSGQKVAFKAVEINFHPTGPKAAPIRLELENDISVRLSNAIRLTLNGNEHTFVSFDCDGFAGLGVDAKVEICPEYVKPFDPETDEITEGRVGGHIRTAMSSWGEFYASITIDPFVVTGVEDVKWLVSNVVFDFSDTQSPTGRTPKDYPHPFAQNDRFDKKWKGFYIELLEARLSNKFAGEGSETIKVGAQNLVIDDLGFSGRVYAADLVPIKTGDAGGWAFSVDRFELSVINNHIKTATLDGKVNVPIFKSSDACDSGTPSKEVEAKDCFDYNAFLEFGNKYHFMVNVGDNGFCVDMMKAGQLKLSSNSGISLKLKEGEFDVEASLHGELSIGYDFGGGKEVTAGDIKFENLIVRNKPKDGKGYFEPGSWSFPSGAGIKLAGFGLTLENISLTKSTDNPEESNLKFTTILNLVKDKTGSNKIDLTAAGTFDLTGQLARTPAGRQRWEFKKFKVNEIFLDGSFPGVEKIKGQLSFYEEDETFGKGFRGMVGVRFKAMGTKVDLDAVAQFGSKTGSGGDFKYFLVDLMAHINPGINMGAFDLNGFGGGVYYRMSRDTASFGGLPTSTTGTPAIPSLGTSLSGIKYTPDESAGLGLKLTVAFATALKKEAFNANATFEMAFNSGGGLKKIWFYGNGRFMEEPDANGSPKYTPGVAPKNDAPIGCNVNIELAFTEGFSLDGTLEVYVNPPSGVLTGYGLAEIHAGSDGWFINIGTPSSPVFLKASVAGMDLLTLTTYLDIGTNIPRMPDLPQEVRSLTGLGNIMANENSRATGRGFAFGAAFHVGTGGRKYFPSKDSKVFFYGEVGGGAGFDIMLQDYGGARCAGGGPIGINGWYASGQAWAYIRAAVGVGVKVWGKRKEFDILDLSAAAALQMKLPNPFVAKGAVGGRFRVLGGLVKGKVNFQFTIGESCQITGGQDPAADLDIILNTYPEDGAVGVSTDTKPSVTFNVPIGESFEAADIDGNTVNYEVKLEYKQLRSGGSNVPVVFEMNEDNTLLQLKPFNMLPASDTMELEIKAILYNGTTVVKTEHDTIIFVTSPALDVIPAGNVIASYPLDGQYNFYKKENKEEKGYILLAAGQPEIFNLREGEAVVAKFSIKGGTSFYTPVTYSVEDYWKPVKVEFDMPSYKFQNETYYKISLMKGQESDFKASHTRTPQSQHAQQTSTHPEPKELHTSYFRTSKYNTFFDKVAVIESSMAVTRNNAWKISADVLGGEEPFDEYELNGSADLKPLVSVSLDEYESNYRSWYQGSIRTLIHDLPINTAICGYGAEEPLISEDEEEDEEETDGSVYFSQLADNDPVLINGEVFLEPSTLTLPGTQSFTFNTIGNYKEEFHFLKTRLGEIRTLAYDECMADESGETHGGPGHHGNSAEMTCTNRITNCLSDLDNLANGTFPTPTMQSYRFMLRYQLPGTDVLTSQKRITMMIP